MNYPARGQMSEDKKYYTAENGSVHESLNGGRWRKIKGAYVLSDAEREACDMARANIRTCRIQRSKSGNGGCTDSCGYMLMRVCPSRRYLAAHKQPDAWEVKP